MIRGAIEDSVEVHVFDWDCLVATIHLLDINRLEPREFGFWVWPCFTQRTALLQNNLLQVRLATRADVLRISTKRLISFALEEKVYYILHSNNNFLLWTRKACMAYFCTRAELYLLCILGLVG